MNEKDYDGFFFRCSMYKLLEPLGSSTHLLRANMFQFLGRVKEIVRVRLWREFAGIGLLDEILVALFLCELNRLFL